MLENKEKIISVIRGLLVDVPLGIPRIFIESHPLYRKILHRGYKKRQIQSAFYNLKHRGYIKDSDEAYKLTSEGKRWATKYYQKYFIKRNGPWNGKWWIILFDIPTEKERQRQAFKKRLKNIGAYMIQKSVFAFPYPCQEEIGDWCLELGLADYVDIIEASGLGAREPDAKKHFEVDV